MAGPLRWRGHEVSRLEGFSDTVFAFALTLLVVALEVPRSPEKLMGLMMGFPAFACCFALLIWIWWEHNTFFRRFGLQDGYTVTLNAALLFSDFRFYPRLALTMIGTMMTSAVLSLLLLRAVIAVLKPRFVLGVRSQAAPVLVVGTPEVEP